MSTIPSAFVNNIMKQIVTDQLDCHISDECIDGFSFYKNVGDSFYMFLNGNTIEYRLPRQPNGYSEASYGFDLDNFNLNDAMEFFGALLDINIANIVNQNEADVNLNIANGNQQQEL